MTVDALKALIATNKVIAIYFDNEHVWKFDTKDDRISNDNIETVGGLDMLKKKMNTHRMEKIGISHCDLPIWIYKPIENIQGVYLLDDESDIGKIDTSRAIYTA